MSLIIQPTTDLESCLRIRFEVFVDEQGVPLEEERDTQDDVALHLIARSGEKDLGTARVVWQGDTAKIGRVCVIKAARGTGLGAELIQACIAEAKTRSGISKVKLGAQIQALGFYEKLGFNAFGPVYLDAGIKHQDMLLELSA